MLRLDRPLAILDLEATGTDPQTARIIQIAIQRLEPVSDGTKFAEKWASFIEPQVDVPGRVKELTGITSEDLEGAPCFEEIGHHLHRLLHDADLCGYNAISYDVPLLEAECQRAFGRGLPGPEDRVVVDPYRLEKQLHPRTLEAVFERYTDRKLEGAHDATADVYATRRVLLQQLRQHVDEPCDAAAIADIARGDYLDDDGKLRERRDGAVEVCFGKHRGKTLQQLADEEPGYFDWMYQTIDDLRPHIDEALT